MSRFSVDGANAETDPLVESPPTPSGGSTNEELYYQKTILQGHYCEKPSAMGAFMAKSSNYKVRTDSEDEIIQPSPTNKKKKKRFDCGRLLKVFRFVAEDWIYLALLGILMALCSLAMDYAIEYLGDFHMKMYDWANGSSIGEYWMTFLVWVSYTVLLTVASALLAHYIAPQAIGSGIPEMKTILRGVILKEYLTFRTLISKMIGLTLSLGSGLPIGKEGPFVHVASVVANLLSHFVHDFKGIYQNESRSCEMLAAGCAVGVACTFSAPIGGVLFSIEVTSVYFAVRNYWRGFFAATCAATVFRVLRVLMHAKEVTVTAFVQTHFPKEAFLPEELPAFAFIGLMCGFGGAAFIALHRNVVLFLRKNEIVKKIFQKYWLIYPALISLIVSSLTYPKGYGRYLGGEIKFTQTLKDFFQNCTFSADPNTTLACDSSILDHWAGSGIDKHSIFLSLAIFQVSFFILAVIASTLPIPAGIFMPVFVIGGCFGRTVGELIAYNFPEGLRAGGEVLIYPGVYAIVGAAAFCGSVTHTVSVAVIVFELTGQLMYILPVMIAVLIANAVCSYLQPSIYDSIIKIKHLPYLPDIPHTSSIYHRILADQIMVTPVRHIARDSNMREVQDILLAMPRIKSFPVVDSKENMILLGSINKSQLHKLLEDKVGTKARLAEAARRVRTALDDVDKRFKMAQTPIKEVASGQIKSSRFTIVPVEKTDSEENENKPVKSNSLTVGPFLNDAEKEAIFAMGKKRNLSEEYNTTSDKSHHKDSDVYHTIGGMFRSITRLSFHKHKKQQRANEFDLYGDDRLDWEQMVLSKKIDVSALTIDPAPFQLVEHTSLFKVHSLFSLLGLNRAYVTECGRLVGVVALRELRLSIEQAQQGVLVPGEIKVDQRALAGEDSDFEDILQPRLEVISRGNTVTSMGALLEMESRQSALERERAEIERVRGRKTTIGSSSTSRSPSVLRKRSKSMDLSNVPTITLQSSESSYQTPLFDFSPNCVNQFSPPSKNSANGSNDSSITAEVRLTIGRESLSSRGSSSDESSSNSNPLRPRKHVKIVIPDETAEL